MNGMENMQIVIPSVFHEYEQMKLPDPDDYQFYLNLGQRVFFVEGVIERDIESGYSSVAQLIKRIISINMDDYGKPVDERKPIVVVIDSPGGDLSLSFSLSDVIKKSVTPVYTVCLGDALSGGFLIFISGAKRFVFPHSQLLCHQGSVGVEGDVSTVQSMMNNHKRVLLSMKNYILENTSIDEKTFNSHKRSDWWISAEDAVEKYGIADAIINDLNDIIKL